MEAIDPLIHVQNVKKSFKEVRAVRGIDLDINKGEFVAILGPNGAGKTTLVEMIEGIQSPDDGDIVIKGKRWKGHFKELNKILGICLQETWFVEKLTAGEILKLFASFYGLGMDRVEEVLEMIKLNEKRNAYSKNLSGGQRQRLALGISLLNYPEVLILDEPTTGLDPVARRDIWNILLNLKKEKNMAMILTTHYMEEAQFLCERIVIIDNGKVLAKGTLNELLDLCDAKEIIDFQLNAKSELFDLRFVPGIKNVRNGSQSNHYILEVDKIVQTMPELIEQVIKQGMGFEKLESRKMTLDDLFVSMTGRHLQS